jgi:hypothetical protein
VRRSDNNTLAALKRQVSMSRTIPLSDGLYSIVTVPGQAERVGCRNWITAGLCALTPAASPGGSSGLTEQSRGGAVMTALAQATG